MILRPPTPHVGIVRQLYRMVSHMTPIELLGWTITVSGMGYLAADESRRIGQKRDAVTFCESSVSSSSSSSSSVEQCPPLPHSYEIIMATTAATATTILYKRAATTPAHCNRRHILK